MSLDPTDRKDAVKGSAWTLGSYGISQALRFGGNLLFAYLLFPEAFGLMALVNLFLQGLQMFSDIGIVPSIIQNPRGENRDFLRTAFTIQVLRGVVLFLASCILAFPVAQWYGAGDPMAYQLLYLLPVAGITALIGGFSSTGIAVLNRRMKLDRIAGLELIPQIGSLIVMAVWGYLFPSVWALVAGGIAFSVIRLVLSHLWNPLHRDGFGWNREWVGELVQFGRWVFLSTVVTFFAINLDRLLLGKLMTLEEFGLYSIGMALAQIGIQVSVKLSSVVIFPLLARKRDEPEAMVAACIEARRSVLWASGAACLAFAVGAPWFFEVIYDDRYREAGRICRWLSIFCWAQVLLASMDRIPLALGRPRVLLYANLIIVSGALASIAGYRSGGLPGFIIGLTAAQVLAHLYVIRTLPASRGAMLRQSAAFSAVLAAYGVGAVGVVDLIPPEARPLSSLLLIGFVAGAPVLLAIYKVSLVVKHKAMVSTPTPSNGPRDSDPELSHAGPHD